MSFLSSFLTLLPKLLSLRQESALQQGPSRGLLAGEPSATGMWGCENPGWEAPNSLLNYFSILCQSSGRQDDE